MTYEKYLNVYRHMRYDTDTLRGMLRDIVHTPRTPERDMKSQALEVLLKQKQRKAER